MKTELPAGYFSTFSLVDPSRSTLDAQRIPQKRNRRVCVCIPCHRRKLKCDKGQPCSRCVLSDSPEDCVYQPSTAGTSRSTSVESRRRTSLQSGRSSPQPVTDSVCTEAKPQLHGVTHWRAIAYEFQEAWPYISGTDPAWEPTYRRIQGYKYLFTSLSGFNFPFGSPYFFESSDQTLQYLPQRQIIDQLVGAYFETLNPIYRLFHYPQFNEELDGFYTDSGQCSEEWLAQLFMVLALGHATTQDDILGSPGELMGSWTERFLDAAQFFFSRSPYLCAPTLTSVRTLCLAVIARMLDLQGAGTSQPTSLTGILNRSAMAIHLDRAFVSPEAATFESEMRKRVWITVQLLDLQAALRTGTPFIHEDQGLAMPLNINDTAIYRTGHGWMVDWEQVQQHVAGTDSTFQARLAELLPTLTEIINTVNSPTRPQPSYDKTRSWDSHLRQHLRSAEACLSPTTHQTQIDFLRLLTHRTLLALHHHHHHSNSNSNTNTNTSTASTAAITNSALAILRIHHAWHTQPPPPPPLSSTTQTHPMNQPLPLPPSRTTHSWQADLHRDTTTAALLYHITSLRQGGSTVTQEGIPEGSTRHRQQRQGQQLAVMEQTLAAYRGRAGRSAGWFGDFVAVSVAVGVFCSLYGSSSGGVVGDERFGSGTGEWGRVMVVRALEEVAERVEQAVLGGPEGVEGVGGLWGCGGAGGGDLWMADGGLFMFESGE